MEFVQIAELRDGLWALTPTTRYVLTYPGPAPKTFSCATRLENGERNQCQVYRLDIISVFCGNAFDLGKGREVKLAGSCSRKGRKLVDFLNQKRKSN
jgi:hypothetical protein